MDNIVNVVMLPNKGAWKKGDIIKGKSLFLAPEDNDMHCLGNGQIEAQHLYLTSLENIAKGEFMYSVEFNKVFQAPYDTTCDKNNYMVVASTDGRTGLPIIPEEFISEYVKENGNIHSVTLEMETVLHEGSSMINIIWKDRIKLTDNNEVIIVNNDAVVNEYKENQLQQQTAQEAGREYLKNKSFIQPTISMSVLNSFIEGAKWQQERAIDWIELRKEFASKFTSQGYVEARTDEVFEWLKNKIK